MSYAFRSPSTLSLLRELDNALSQADSNNYSHSSRHGLPHMHCDVAETKDAFVIQADLPGVPKDDISVSVDKNVLTIQAKKVPPQADEKTDGSRFYIQERRTGKVSRSFELPANVDFDSASSAFENGVLSVTIKKVPAPAPRKLQIQ